MNGESQTNKPKTNYLTIGTVVLVAIVAAIVLSQFKQAPQLPPLGDTEGVGTTTGDEGTGKPSTFAKLTAEQRILLQGIKDDAPEADKKNYNDLLAKYAVATSVLVLKECIGDPLVLKTSVGSRFTVRNDGSSEITLSVLGKDYPIAAGGGESFEAGFGKGQGLFGLTCAYKDGGGPVMVWVTE